MNSRILILAALAVVNGLSALFLVRGLTRQVPRGEIPEDATREPVEPARTLSMLGRRSRR